jgi:putative colanic acid biosynthesis acetyltransferase WcaF
MKTDLSHYDNSWYHSGGNVLKRTLWYFVNILFLKSHLNPLSGLKVRLLRFFGAKVGMGVVIKPGVNVKYPWLLTLGDYVWIGENVWIDNLAQVTIGSNVCISQGAMLLCGNHNYKKSTFDLMVGEIVLEDGCWIGAKSVVCPSVRVKSHAVLGVLSVANRNLDAFGIYQGNPAVKVRERQISEE